MPTAFSGPALGTSTIQVSDLNGRFEQGEVYEILLLFAVLVIVAEQFPVSGRSRDYAGAGTLG